MIEAKQSRPNKSEGGNFDEDGLIKSTDYRRGSSRDTNTRGAFRKGVSYSPS